MVLRETGHLCCEVAKRDPLVIVVKKGQDKFLKKGVSLQQAPTSGFSIVCKTSFLECVKATLRKGFVCTCTAFNNFPGQKKKKEKC